MMYQSLTRAEEYENWMKFKTIRIHLFGKTLGYVVFVNHKFHQFYPCF